MAEQIYGLIAKAMSKVGAIGKDSTATNINGKQMYKFRGIDAVYNALNPVMSELGLFICPEVLEQTREERKSNSGTTLIYSILKIRFTMYAPDGSNVSCVVIGEGMDSGDKASNKAMSIALKYACFELFMIPTEEMVDPDAEVHEVMPRQTPPPKSVTKSTTSPIRQDSPAMVEAVEKIPPVNPVQAYINNEIAFMSQRLEISDKKEMMDKFNEMRTSLIKSGTIKDIKSSDMTMDQAKQMIEAMYVTFFTDGGQKWSAS